MQITAERTRADVVEVALELAGQHVLNVVLRRIRNIAEHRRLVEPGELRGARDPREDVEDPALRRRIAGND